MNQNMKMTKQPQEEFSFVRFCLEYGVLTIALGLCLLTTVISSQQVSYIKFLNCSGFVGILLILFFIELNLQQVDFFNTFQWKLRLQRNHGIWSGVLLPLLLYSLCQDPWKKCSGIYRLFVIEGFVLVFASLTLFGLVIPYIHNSSHSKSRQDRLLTIHILVYSLITTILLICFTQINFKLGLLVSLFVQCMFHHSLWTLLKLCPQSFSLGEALIITQGITLFTTYACFEMFNSILSDVLDDSHQMLRFALAALLGCEISIYGWIKFPSLRSTFGFYVTFLSTVVLIILPFMAFVVHENPILWLMKFCIKTPVRIILFVCWLFFTSLAVLAAVKLNDTVPVSISIVRKSFHVLLLAVYIPGILYDINLLYLGSLLLLAVFLILECARVMKIWPFGHLLHQYLVGLLDEKDQGAVILTHIYLLVGCSLPIWINPPNQGFRPMILSGLLSLGVGDTVASIGGSLFGRHRLPGTKKTLEGTLMSILSQLMALAVWNFFGMYYEIPCKAKLILLVTLSSFLEALTLQIDNIVIPLFMYISWLFI